VTGRVYLDRLERVWDGFFQLLRATVRFEKLDGSTSAPMERLVFERGDSVAVLLYDAALDQVILAQQLRVPVYLREGTGWLLEIVAGTLEPGRTPEEVVRSEALEEVGYCLEALQPIATVYLSPGACTERIHIYIAQVSAEQRVAVGGGLPASGEDIRVCAVAFAEALAMARDGRIRDAKTVLALQYLALERAREAGRDPGDASGKAGRPCTVNAS